MFCPVPTYFPGLTTDVADKDKAAYEGHFKTDYFQALGQLLPREGVLGAPLDIKTIKPVGGFESR